VKKDIALLKAKLGDGFQVTNRTLDDSLWTVAADDPKAPAVAYLYDRKAGSVTKLFEQRPKLGKAPLVPMQALELKAARRPHAGFLSIAAARAPMPTTTAVPRKPVPLVLNVHGGPWARDDYGFDAEHQWLANRGYACCR
jgi:dipeptidyl aminopeptidase/acylaminoacyl peptidase